MSRHAELEEAAYITPTIRKQGVMTACAHPTFIFFYSPEPELRKWCHQFLVRSPTFNPTIRSFYKHFQQLNNPSYVSLEDWLQEILKPIKLTILTIMSTKQKNPALRKYMMWLQLNGSLKKENNGGRQINIHREQAEYKGLLATWINSVWSTVGQRARYRTKCMSCSTLWVDPEINYGLWVIIMSQCRVSDCNKYTLHWGVLVTWETYPA